MGWEEGGSGNSLFKVLRCQASTWYNCRKPRKTLLKILRWILVKNCEAPECNSGLILQFQLHDLFCYPDWSWRHSFGQSRSFRHLPLLTCWATLTYVFTGTLRQDKQIGGVCKVVLIGQKKCPWLWAGYNSSVKWLAVSQMVGIGLPAEAGLFFHHTQTCSGTHPHSQPMNTGCSFLANKAA
jgi:hypothetical protein